MIYSVAMITDETKLEDTRYFVNSICPIIENSINSFSLWNNGKIGVICELFEIGFVILQHL